MNDTSPNPAVDDALMETLVAYMDGELTSEEASQIEQRLAVDSACRELYHSLQRAWSLLDELPMSSAGHNFSNSTVTMVAHSTTRSITKGAPRNAGWMPWVFGAMAMGALTVASYVAAAKYFARPNQQLLRDLPLIQNVDMYRNVEDIEFLRSLIEESPFATGGTDA